MKTYNLVLVFFLKAATHQVLSKNIIARPRFVGGYTCDIQDKARFAVSIYSNLMCGGTLVHQEWILTAAHCLTKEATFNVSVIARAGFNSPSNLIQERLVEEFHLHEKYMQYNASGMLYDIALAGVSKPFDLSPVAQVVRLPEVGFASGCQSGLALGIGLIRPNDKIIKRRKELYERPLMCVDLPLVHDVKLCQNAYKKAEFDDTLFCASGTGKDTCTGDSGGPLICNGRVIGIVADGLSDCGSPKTTTIYTKVESYLDFIKKYVKIRKTVPRKLQIVENRSKHVCRWKLVFILAFTFTLTYFA